ncbi:FUSC family protein [Salinimicrobium sp. MT39]|uniref:FUSC family protein n=1 Tax=Salinimicrobium profundisediminis TaxID=2994553 RepID=A0A9X3I0B7_9FLAO|nr:FUSC family membrane protein [Salinimicrobium profundisediminis]MCX2837364.1 FUSC family protein [Salinimicrobium profundisediminis]
MNLYRQLQSFFTLLKTGEFSKGIRFAVAAIVPLLVTSQMGEIKIGIAMAVGVLLTSPSDVPGSLRRRVIGVSLSIAIAVAATILTGLSLAYPVFFIVVLVLQIFHYSMISVFGFRASLIAFSGLFAVVLSMTQVTAEGSILLHAFWIGMGGVWYLLFSLFFHYLLQRRETDQLLRDVFELTAQYLEKRSHLMSVTDEKREQAEKELFALQTSINEKHEIIRELVITRRKNFGRSEMVRKRLLIFMELVDILELGMAHPVNFSRMRALFVSHEDKIQHIQEWSLVMAAHLRILGQTPQNKFLNLEEGELLIKRRQAWKAYKEFEASANKSTDAEALLVYRNFLNFKEKQHQKLLSLMRLMKEWKGDEKLKLGRKDAAKFLTTPDYNFKTLQDNLDFKSPIFRHSLRLTVVMALGYVIGEFFAVQNAYWILLTTLVIMRPGYALTQERFKHRLYGTLIGGAVAISLVFFIRNQTVYAILAVICLVLAHSMIQRNYKTAAAFITLNVIFVYSLLKPNVLEVIEFRVLDTVVGAGLAFLGAKFLWPTWEYTLIQNFIRESIKANLSFLKEVEAFYNHKSALPASYRLARKKAFLAMGDLNAAFQRMAQEPKTDKKHLEEIFRIVSLNQEFLSATVSLGTFIRSHPTTKASAHFANYLSAIKANLQASVKNDEAQKEDLSEEIDRAATFYENLYQELLDLEKDESVEKEGVREKLQEVHILTDRLKWLLEMSEGLQKTMGVKR